jgi:tetratricopeptide (TPR) repeat protein
MLGELGIFIKKTYKLSAIIAGIAVFFLVYHIYLVDSSLDNLRLALDKANEVKTFKDAKRLADMLDYSLITEVTRTRMEASNFSRIELAKDILDKTQDISQLDDARFVLQEVVVEKEKARSPFLVVLDKVNKIFVPFSRKFTQVKLTGKVKSLKHSISMTQDRAKLQKQYYELAGLYAELLRFQDAKSAYQEAIALNPDSDLARKSQFNIAWNEKKMGNLVDSEKTFLELAKTIPKSELGILSQIQVADILNKKGNYAQAIDIYRQVAIKRPDSELGKIAEFKTGYTYLYDLKDYVKAKDAFDKLKVSASGTNMSAYIENKGIPAVLAQYRQEAFQPLIAGYKTASSAKYEEALKIFDKILALSPHDSVTFAGKALAYLWLNDPEKALSFAREAVRFAPKDEVSSANLSYVYIQLKMYEEAIKESKRLIMDIPNSLISYYNLGYGYVMTNQLEEGIRAFKEAIKINPKFVMAYNNLGWCNWKLKRPALAIEAFEKAVKLNPSFFDALFNLAVVYNNIGRYNDARKLFMRVLELKPIHIVFRGGIE